MKEEKCYKIYREETRTCIRAPGQLAQNQTFTNCPGGGHLLNPNLLRIKLKGLNISFIEKLGDNTTTIKHMGENYN